MNPPPQMAKSRPPVSGFESSSTAPRSKAHDRAAIAEPARETLQNIIEELFALGAIGVEK